jgi:hypothetical protein
MLLGSLCLCGGTYRPVPMQCMRLRVILSGHALSAFSNQLTSSVIGVVLSLVQIPLHT